MTQSIAGQPAPELEVPYWIDAEGKERPPLTLKELGARHGLLFFYQHWCGGCHSHGFPTLQALAQYPHRGRRGRRSPDRIRGRLRQYARQVTPGPAALRPPDSLRARGPFSHAVLPTTMESRIEVAMLAV